MGGGGLENTCEATYMHFKDCAEFLQRGQLFGLDTEMTAFCIFKGILQSLWEELGGGGVDMGEEGGLAAEMWGSQWRHAEPIIVSLTLSN